jgi:hypothetical protein
VEALVVLVPLITVVVGTASAPFTIRDPVSGVGVLMVTTSRVELAAKSTVPEEDSKNEAVVKPEPELVCNETPPTYRAPKRLL